MLTNMFNFDIIADSKRIHFKWGTPFGRAAEPRDQKREIISLENKYLKEAAAYGIIVMFKKHVEMSKTHKKPR